MVNSRRRSSPWQDREEMSASLSLQLRSPWHALSPITEEESVVVVRCEDNEKQQILVNQTWTYPCTSRHRCNCPFRWMTKVQGPSTRSLRCNFRSRSSKGLFQWGTRSLLRTWRGCTPSTKRKTFQKIRRRLAGTLKAVCFLTFLELFALLEYSAPF